MQAANCPSCGASITFQSAVSILAVCDYCRSTLVRHDLELENIGRMAELLADASPVQLQTQGRYHGKAFTVVGRIQLRYAQGLWNEWYLLFDDQSGGWLGETLGNYVVTFLVKVPETIPPFSELRVGQPLRLQGKVYEVSNLENAQCIGGEGELPLLVGPGYVAPVVDLRGVGTDKAFATLDYSEDPPLVFIGEQVEFKTLRLTGLRDREAQEGPPRALDGQALRPELQVEAFQCPGCGSTLRIRAKGTEALACGSCGSIIDIHDENHQILSRYQAQVIYQPLIPLGSRGKLFGAEYEVIGYLRRKMRIVGVDYEWSEYLLYHPEQGFRWLAEYQGHWNFSMTTSYPPKRLDASEPPRLYYRGNTFRHFQTANATVSYVLGEFYWRVQVGEQCVVSDYVAPPFLLSQEQTDREIIWSIAEYLEPELIWAAFKPRIPINAPIGIAPNQPNPAAGPARQLGRLLAVFVIVLVLLQSGFFFASQHKLVFQQNYQFDQSLKDKTLTTETFELTGHPSNVIIESRSNVDNNWLYLDITLVNEETGAVYPVGREISYYHGVDEGEAWSEGSQADSAVLAQVPAGRYYLNIEPETPGSAVSYEVQVYRDRPGWSNFFIALTVLLLLPLFSLWKKRSFENARWSESDHPPSGSSS
jgi:hypothetical protein